MDADEAVDFIRPAIAANSGVWADFGAGSGTFTRALLRILDEHSRVVAVDKDRAALNKLSSSVSDGRAIAVTGDIRRIDSLQALDSVLLDGALFANSLHYLADPQNALSAARTRMRPGARLVVIEYERTTANQWVPYPLPFDRLRSVMAEAGFTQAVQVASRRSRFQGVMYCASADRPADVSGS